MTPSDPEPAAPPAASDPGRMLSLTFDNSHGGTYIVRATVLYDTPGTTGTTRFLSVSGGQTATMDGLPFEAVNLRVELDFVAGETLHLADGTPGQNWPQNHGFIDLYGVWPFACRAEWRTG